jgi:Zinc finger, C3HC4 type (RING finger)
MTKRPSSEDESSSKRSRSLQSEEASEDSSASGEESPASNEASLSDDPVPSAQSIEKLNDILTCNLCGDEFRWPAIACVDCEHSFCEACVDSWGHAKTGGASQVPCPYCKKLNGFRRNETINRVVGERKIDCPNACGANFSVRDRDQHLEKICKKQQRRCAFQRHGCDWSGMAKAQHELGCVFAKLAGEQRRIEEAKQDALGELNKAKLEVDKLTQLLQKETQRCCAIVESKKRDLELYVASLSSSARCSEFAVKRIDDNTCMVNVRLRDSTVSQMQLRIQLKEDNTYELYGSMKDLRISYPIAFCCIFINQAREELSVVDSVQFKVGRFGQPLKEQLMFSEDSTLKKDFSKPGFGVHFRIAFTAL